MDRWVVIRKDHIRVTSFIAITASRTDSVNSLRQHIMHKINETSEDEAIEWAANQLKYTSYEKYKSYLIKRLNKKIYKLNFHGKQNITWRGEKYSIVGQVPLINQVVARHVSA